MTATLFPLFLLICFSVLLIWLAQDDDFPNPPPVIDYPQPSAPRYCPPCHEG